jgi:hypothetical protein
MTSLQELSKALNEHPENTDDLLGAFLKATGNETEVQQLRIIFSQLQRAQKIFAGIRNQLEDVPDINTVLYHCGNSLDNATSAFGFLVRRLERV